MTQRVERTKSTNTLDMFYLETTKRKGYYLERIKWLIIISVFTDLSKTETDAVSKIFPYYIGMKYIKCSQHVRKEY